MAPMEFRRPLVLDGTYVRLTPLEAADAPALFAATRDPEVWRFLRFAQPRTIDEMAVFLDGFLEQEADGEILPMTIRLRERGTVVGAIRFLEIRRQDRAVEIGTWIGSAWWRTPVNTEAKWLTMRHAFEVEGVERFELLTDLRNERSQRAIERLGAVREAVLRDHRRRGDGTWRNSVVYSVLADEWPSVRARLEASLARPFERPLARAA